eukprot:jgi/Astpho2/4289/fgenesh1_pg.00064_%23_74_t
MSFCWAFLSTCQHWTCCMQQGGWERHQSLAPVLIQGSWALLTCKCRSAGPSGGSDRLCLVKLPTGASEQVYASMSAAPCLWMDFAASRFEPYAVTAGATDMVLPFIAQGRANEILVWKAGQQYPLHRLQQPGTTVPLLAIERIYGEGASLRGGFVAERDVRLASSNGREASKC